MIELVAQLRPNGIAIVPLPCKCLTPLGALAVARSMQVERVCLHGYMHSLVPLPDRTLEVIGSRFRNPPGTLVVLHLEQVTIR